MNIAFNYACNNRALVWYDIAEEGEDAVAKPHSCFNYFNRCPLIKQHRILNN